MALEKNIRQTRAWIKKTTTYIRTEYLKTVRNPAPIISMTKLRFTQTNREIWNKGASIYIPVEKKLGLVCKINCIEDEKHFLIR